MGFNNPSLESKPFLIVTPFVLTLYRVELLVQSFLMTPFKLGADEIQQES